MSPWERSCEITNEELNLAKKKKKALDELLVKNRMSQPTYEYLLKDLKKSIFELEAQQKSLAQKMTSRANELKKQIDLLDLFLANLEIHHVAGEVEEENYSRDKEVLITGLEATKTELSQISDSLTKIASHNQTIPLA